MKVRYFMVPPGVSIYTTNEPEPDRHAGYLGFDCDPMRLHHLGLTSARPNGDKRDTKERDHGINQPPSLFRVCRSTWNRFSAANPGVVLTPRAGLFSI